MRKSFWQYSVMTTTLIFTASCFGLIIPTNNKSVDLYLGLFGSTHNPALQTGCYVNTTNVLTGKQLIEYHYTTMDCVDSVTKFTTPGMRVSVETSPAESEDIMQRMLTRASAFQLGLNFSFNS